MPSVTAFTLSMLLLAVTGCLGSSASPPAAEQQPAKKASTVKPAAHDEQKSMNEDSHNAVMDR
ncbi:MAG: hypothetical protein ABIR36_14505 [Nitrospiraceae bacterium]